MFTAGLVFGLSMEARVSDNSSDTCTCALLFGSHTFVVCHTHAVFGAAGKVVRA